VTGIDFREHAFTAPRERRSLLLTVLQSLVAVDQDMRVLDLGCGTGTQLLDVAAAFPRAICVGLDISPRSIESARMQAGACGGRVQFHCADYMTFDIEPFDIILADSVLQNIAGSTEALARKLGNDLTPGARLIASLPYDGWYNRLLWAGRRVLQRFRSPALERMALAAAKVVHSGWPDSLLRERIPYLYLLPERIDGPALRERLRVAGGLAVEKELPMPHASISQPRHRLVIFRKTTA
jgi:trans-aconitate 2-methyltransferase